METKLNKNTCPNYFQGFRRKGVDILLPTSQNTDTQQNFEKKFDCPNQLETKSK